MHFSSVLPCHATYREKKIVEKLCVRFLSIIYRDFDYISTEMTKVFCYDRNKKYSLLTFLYVRFHQHLQLQLQHLQAHFMCALV